MEPETPIDESGSQVAPKRPFKPACGPKCRCRLCKAARQRAEEALNGSTGVPSPSAASGSPVEDENDPKLNEVIDGNPVMIATRRSKRDRVAEWILLRSQGMRNQEIAARMGIKSSTLSTLVSKAAREGWLKFDSPADRLEYELAPLVVDNVRAFLDARDKQMTIEAAKGMGLFKTHQAVKIEGEQAPTVIALRIDIAEPTTVREGGTIVGVPKHALLEGTVIKTD